MPATMKAVAAACTLLSLLAGCAAPGAPGPRDGIASGSPAASAPAPRFAPSGPDAEDYGASDGYPTGDRTSFFRTPFLVGSHSQLDQERRAKEARAIAGRVAVDRKSTRLNSSHVRISHAGFCF